MPFTATFIVLSFAGLINSGYLVWKHYFEKKPLVCPIEGHDCNIVVLSKWGRVFGVRNEILGAAYYAGMLASGIFTVVTGTPPPVIPLFVLIAASGGLLFSIFLTFLQKYVIKEYCFYCLMSAGIALLLFINSLVLYI